MPSRSWSASRPKLRDHQGSVPKAATELAKEWRTDRILRRLEAMLIVLDRDNLLLLSGTGDVIAPTDNVLAIGSGGPYALAAARALLAHTQLNPAEVVRAGLEIAGDICIYTNRNIEVVELDDDRSTRGYDSGRILDAPTDRCRAGSIHRRADRGQAGRGGRHPQSLATAAALRTNCAPTSRPRTSS